MTRKRTKDVVPPAPAPVDTPATDREALIAAYQAGLIARGRTTASADTG
jgi:hypothetical protein